MYYEELLVEGKMMYRTSPEGEWEEFSKEMLNRRVAHLEDRLTHAEETIDTQHKTLECLKDIIKLGEGDE